MKKFAFVLFLSLLYSAIWAEKKIAITIDDLPFVGTTNGKEGNLQREHDRFMRILDALVSHKVPATGFIIAGSIEKGQWALLEEFKNNGFPLGNHTYSHPSLNRMTAEQYIADIARADQIITPLFSGQKYFRYPYLAESSGQKKEKVYQYLADNHYVIAPVTIDSKDYQFNAQFLAISWRQRDNYLPQIKKRYLDYIWKQTLKAESRTNADSKAQILLIHANLLNSHLLGDVIDMYQKNGYTIVSLDEALTSPAEPLQGIGAGTKPVAVDVSPNISYLF